MTFVSLLLLGFIGLFFHWLNRWSQKRTKNNFIQYMKVHKKHSVSSVTAIVAAIVSMFVAGDVELTNQTMANAFLLGYAIDSAVNKDDTSDK